MSDTLEIVFKGERKELYINPQQFPFKLGDYAIVEADKGEDLGIVNQLGFMLSMKKAEGPMRKILRKPSSKDLESYYSNRKKEAEAFKTCKSKIDEHDLTMKLVDVEYQFDGNKITFYFTAEKRVDFRTLVKDLANEYKVRIELRQIGVRDEAKRIGGYGICGRKLCCTTFLREFEPITTQSAKEQNLPLNPQKLSGLCGRLLCCLNYERNFYQEQIKKFPALLTQYKTLKGVGTLVKYDVFAEEVTLEYENNEFENFQLADLSGFENLGKAKKKEEKSSAE
jgi:cell fate regulator YaaT (PSP1 superfamily)